MVSRSEDSLISEAERMASRPGFNGIIYDVGGPTANMYGIECPRKAEKGACPDRRCLHPRPCPSLGVDHSRQIRLLERLTDVPGVRRVFVASGIRYDMVVSDRAHGQEYIDRIAAEHTSGQLKIAPEHVSKNVLYLMGKPGPNVLLDFKDMFDAANERCGRNQFLTYYFIAAHPGCGNREMEEAARFCREELHARPEQVQVFTPTPSTVSTLMYRTGRDLQDERGVWSEHDPGMKRRQKEVMLPPSGRRGKRRERRPAQRSLEPCNRFEVVSQIVYLRFRHVLGENFSNTPLPRNRARGAKDRIRVAHTATTELCRSSSEAFTAACPFKRRNNRLSSAPPMTLRGRAQGT